MAIGNPGDTFSQADQATSSGQPNTKYYMTLAGVYTADASGFSVASPGYLLLGGKLTQTHIAKSSSQDDQDAKIAAQETKISTKAEIDLATNHADDNAAKAAHTEDAVLNVGGVVKLYDAESDTVSPLAATYEDVDQFYHSRQAILDARTAATDKAPFDDQTASFGVLADDGSYKVYRWDTVSDFAEIATSVAPPETKDATPTAASTNAVESQGLLTEFDALDSTNATQDAAINLNTTHRQDISNFVSPAERIAWDDKAEKIDGSTWVAATGVLTIDHTDGSSTVANVGVPNVLQAVAYDAPSKSFNFTFVDTNVINVPATDLFDATAYTDVTPDAVAKTLTFTRLDTGTTVVDMSTWFTRVPAPADNVDPVLPHLWAKDDFDNRIKALGEPITLTGTNEEMSDRHLHKGPTASKPALTLAVANADHYSAFFDTDKKTYTFYVADPADPTKLVASQSVGSGLRGDPVADIAGLKDLTARDGERRYVKDRKSDYHFKLTADLTAAENTSPSSEADNGGTGKWIRESFAALVDGYTYSGIDVANSSFGSGAISFKSSSFNTIHDPKGLVDVDNSFNISIDSPEKAGAYLMALNVTSGSVSGRVNARVNGTTKLIASGEDSADSDAAMGVVELVEGDVVTLAVTGGGTTYGVSFTMTQTRRFVDQTQYVSTDQLEPVADNSRIVATGFGPSGGTAHADITTFTVPEDGDYEYETNVEGFQSSVLAWNKTLQVRDETGGGGNLIMSQALTMGASATTAVRKMANPAFGTVTLQAGVTYTTRLIHVNEFTDQLSPVTLILRKVPKTVEVLDTNLIPADTTEVGTPLNAGSARHYVMQWDGTKLVNTLAYEVWTEGTLGNSGYRKYMVDHLLGHARIAGRNVITSSGTINWNLDFAAVSGYVFAHDLREAQAETASIRVNSRTVNSLSYTLHDSAGTGDSGSNVQFELSGDL